MIENKLWLQLLDSPLLFSSVGDCDRLKPPALTSIMMAHTLSFSEGRALFRREEE